MSTVSADISMSLEGQLIVYEFLSLDGRFEGPPGAEMDWVQKHFSPELENDLADQYASLGAFLMGRRTFDSLASYWPTPAASQEYLVHSMNAIPKLVASHRPEVSHWPNSHHLGDQPLTALPKELHTRGDIMVIGSGDLVCQLAQADLVDEYRLLVFPEILGTGRRLFDTLDRPASLATHRNEIFPGGVIALHSRTRHATGETVARS